MTYVEKDKLGGEKTEDALQQMSEHDLLKVSWEGEIFGVGMFETMAGMYPQYADELTAGATMEWYNIHQCEEFGHAAGVHVSLEEAEKLGRQGADLVSKNSFEDVANMVVKETPEADKMYRQLGKGADTPELKAFANDLFDHENALRAWVKSELDGKSDGAEKIFAYLERNGISRADAVVPRKDREDRGGKKQQLVLAFFDTEDSADQAAEALRNWEKATEYMKVDGTGVLVYDHEGKVQEGKLGKRAGKRGMGIGVALGLVASIRTAGYSPVDGILGGGGTAIGEFFHKGLKMTDEAATRVGAELEAGHPAVGVLTWDSETEAVADKLKNLGGTPQSHEVAKLTADES